ncbi:hypothetical protein BD309DRAFT_945418 [Dichomitus squalens]|nr:hypothetical protein BD309DRAFT_945418 [Dichomitus squalens]
MRTVMSRSVRVCALSLSAISDMVRTRACPRRVVGLRLGRDEHLVVVRKEAEKKGSGKGRGRAGASGLGWRRLDCARGIRPADVIIL